MNEQHRGAVERQNEEELAKAWARLRLRLCSFRFGTIGVQFTVHEGVVTNIEFIDKEKVRV